jgi:hypothetical protein
VVVLLKKLTKVVFSLGFLSFVFVWQVPSEMNSSPLRFLLVSRLSLSPWASGPWVCYFRVGGRVYSPSSVSRWNSVHSRLEASHELNSSRLDWPVCARKGLVRRFSVLTVVVIHVVPLDLLERAWYEGSPCWRL